MISEMQRPDFGYGVIRIAVVLVIKYLLYFSAILDYLYAFLLHFLAKVLAVGKRELQFAETLDCLILFIFSRCVCEVVRFAEWTCSCEAAL